MENIFKGKISTVIIILVTLVLAGVAIFTAVRLYNLRQEPVAPNVPSSKPLAQEMTATPSTCSLSFTLTTTPIPCNHSCSLGEGATPCLTGLSCLSADSQGQTEGFIACRNLRCPTKTDCLCGTATPTPTATPRATPTVRPTSTPTPRATPTVRPTSTPTPRATPTVRPTSTPTSTATSTATTRPTTTVTTAGTATPAPKLPDSGINWPTVVSITLGISVIIGSLLLAL